MRDSKYVVVQLICNDLKAEQFDTYDDALQCVTGGGGEAYIIRIEDFCADCWQPINITLEPHL